MKKFNELTEGEIVSAALDLKRMMDSDSFKYAVDLLSDTHLDKFYNSNPADIAAREHTYRSNLVLKELLGTMKTIILTGQQIEEKNSYEDYN